MTKQSISISVFCLHPPAYDAASMDFGLQDKAAALHRGSQQADGSLRFDFELSVSQDDNGSPKFSGSFAHGPRQARFLYLTTKRLQGGSWEILRRIKIPLKSITWAQVEQALAEGGRLQVAISGQGTATVPLLGEGWTVLHRS